MVVEAPVRALVQTPAAACSSAACCTPALAPRQPVGSAVLITGHDLRPVAAQVTGLRLDQAPKHPGAARQPMDTCRICPAGSLIWLAGDDYGGMG